MAVESGRVRTPSGAQHEPARPPEELEVDYDGCSFEVGFNARYILDAAAQMAGEAAQFPLLRRHGLSSDLVDPDPAARPERRGACRYVPGADAGVGLPIFRHQVSSSLRELGLI